MALYTKRYKRIFILLGFSLVLWIVAILLRRIKLEFTGDTFQVASICIIAYVLIFSLLKKKKIIYSESIWERNEFYLFLSLGGSLSLIGFYESLTTSVITTLIFSELLVFTFIIYYIKFRNKNIVNKGEHILKKWGFLRTSFWLFGVVITVLLIVSVLKGFNPVLNILDPFYFIYVFVFLIDWIIRHFNTTIKLRNEKAKTELMHLKSQVNPHFFFNMLNNLYGLVGTDAKKAQDLILQLSDMMRYSIYEGEKDKVTLKEEVEYLKNYIALHKMRYHKSIDVKFNIDIEEDYKVLPLLFIILLENAFKHGVENLRKNAYVYVSMTTKENNIYFEIENNFDESQLSEEPGIGLKNLKRRLELVYPGNILFIEAYGNYTKIYLKGEMIIGNEKISSFENLLSKDNFLRVHKSFIVAIDKIKSIESNRIYIDSHKIPIGLTYKSNISKIYNT